MIAPKAIIENGKVINHQQLERYYRDKHERDYLIQRGIFRDLREAQRENPEKIPQVIEHIHRHSDMSKKEFDLLQQMILKVEYLEKCLNERKPSKKVSKYT